MLYLAQEPLYLSRARAHLCNAFTFRVLYVALCHGGQTNARVNVVRNQLKSSNYLHRARSHFFFLIVIYLLLFIRRVPSTINSLVKDNYIYETLIIISPSARRGNANF